MQGMGFGIRFSSSSFRMRFMISTRGERGTSICLGGDQFGDGAFPFWLDHFADENRRGFFLLSMLWSFQKYVHQPFENTF